MVSILIAAFGSWNRVCSMPSITPFEAAGAAKWFCKCVDAVPDERMILVSYRPQLNTQSAPVPVYFVYFGTTVKATTLSIEVDATSGDVISFQRYPDPERFHATISGRQYINLNGSASALFILHGTSLYSYNGVGGSIEYPFDGTSAHCLIRLR